MQGKCIFCHEQKIRDDVTPGLLLVQQILIDYVIPILFLQGRWGKFTLPPTACMPRTGKAYNNAPCPT